MGRVERFEKLRFGLFIHFGLYSLLQRGEWIQYNDPAVRNDYEQLKEVFNPVNLNWKEIVSCAARAGCRYIVLTARHHDGFSLYDTKGLSEYDVLHTPYGKDIIRDFVTECRKQNMIPFLYHTTLDWRHPAFEKSFDDYLEYLQESIRILCTSYGEPGGFWFDGNWSRPEADWREESLYTMIRSYYPDVILINNTGLEERGKKGSDQLDVLTYEQGHITDSQVEGRHLAREACETMNGHWGIARNDIHYKSPKQLIDMLNTCRRNDANYLLNVGLNPDGSMPSMCKGLLETIGIWTEYASDSFYEGDIHKLGFNRNVYAIDCNDNTYLYIADIPVEDVDHVTAKTELFDPELIIEGIEKPVRNIFWKDTGQSLHFVQHESVVKAELTPFPYGCDLLVRIAVIAYK